jgi:DNA-binding beta-propeller fold protein YncE
VDADQDAVWALGIDGTITRIDLRSGRRAKRAARGLGESIAPGARTVWVLRIDGRATQVDRESLVMRRTIAVGGYTQDIVAAGDSAWVLLQQSRGIVRLDATTNSVIDTIQTGLTDFSARMALGAGALWLTDPRERSVRRIPIG